ncbi:uncharacterized protein F5147DRAFT_327486 [Suillus discolor]|uniref:Uncharacterized protein n=1 Tax=Suillus discolor TaxID=1912936 RepID=A0A9P7F090_9AGAM|nr:uncharacterized protein F5147DRAFT_327486 [Suillus discolor]KAG2100152.1 hypothetical protein F5147DRAFT_327486 [Suillus discolor]
MMFVQGMREVHETRKREAAQRLEMAQEWRRSRVKIFYRHLVDKGLIDEDGAKNLPDDTLDCPICPSKQTSCNLCRFISCSNIDCQASSTITIVRCFNHHETKFCTSCLECPGILPRMGKCPICAHWFCSAELEWCIGRPVSNGDTRGTEPSSPIIGPPSPITDSTRSHPARPLFCRTRHCIEESIAIGKNGARCCNEYCWFSWPLHIRTCPDCITQDDFTCPCGGYWACADCTLFAATCAPDSTYACPGCGRRFCFNCSYIGACELCSHGGLCDDCKEHEENIGVKQTVFRCQGCGFYLCGECAGIDEKSCCEYDRSVCKLCRHDDMKALTSLFWNFISAS